MSSSPRVDVGSPTAGPSKPTSLRPPETIISPPSPIDNTTSMAAFANSPSFLQPEGNDEDDESVQYDSPESEGEEDEKTLSPITSRLGHGVSADTGRPSSNNPMAATQISSSPGSEPSLLTPRSPLASPIPRKDTQSPLHPRAPSPSSPLFRPKPMHHRRTSSSHRVRETTRGEQRDTEDGRMVNQYKIGTSLGNGAYAKVELALDVQTGEQYAIKEFSISRLRLQALQQRQRQSSRARTRRPPSRGMQSCKPIDNKPVNDTGPWGDDKEDAAEQDPLSLIRREIAVMKKLDHPNIVHLYEAIAVPDADSLYLVLEYLPGGVLMKLAMGSGATNATAPFETWQVREYFRQLCLGLEYLHANGVVHRDIKPDNILLSSDRSTVKLCDFGVSEMFDSKGDDRIKKAGGSPAFLSPESFAATDDIHGPAVDVWALGVTLYCMLTGKLPFNLENPIELFEAVQKQEPVLEDGWDPDLKDLLHGMFKKDPHVRISIAAIREHAWVTERGAQPMITKDDNLYYLGQEVQEPTQDEVSKAIGFLHRMFTVVRAVQKMRRLQLHRRTLSSQSSNDAASTFSPVAQPPSRGASTDMSFTSSIDSYGSMPEGSSTTSRTDVDDRWKGLAQEETMSPSSIGSEVTSPGSWGKPMPQVNPFDNLKPIETALPKKEEEGGGGEVVFDSPTSEEGTPVPVR